MVREAGGLVGDLDGNEQFMQTGRIVAANGKIFSAMLNALKAK